MLDYSTAMRQSPSSIAYLALMAAMQSIGTDAFRPLDRLAWMSNIDLVTNRMWKECRAMAQSSSAAKHAFLCCSAVSPSTPGSPSTPPVPPEAHITGHHPYLDVLSIASSRVCATSNCLSPVSSMFDEFQCSNR